MKYKSLLLILFSTIQYFSAQVLDDTFGTNGKVVYDINSNLAIEKISSMVALNNDKLLVGGSDNVNAYLVRHNSDGTIDTSFQNNGVKQFSFKSIEKILKTSTNEIIVLGTKIGSDGYNNIIVSKMDENGNLVTTFGNNGTLEINFAYQSDDNVFNGELQSDGKIILVGNKSGTPLQSLTEGFVLRLLPNGQFDTSFNNTGLFTIAPINHRHYLYAVSISPNGNITCSGYLILSTSSNQARMFALRLLPNGNLDTSFASVGYTYFNVTNQGNSISRTHILLSDGSLLMGGYSYSSNNNNVLNNFTIVKLNINGSFDNSFGNNGVVQTLLPNTGGEIKTLKLDPSNNIIASGSTYSVQTGNENFTIMKYNQAGNLDSQFGNSGIVTTDFYGFQDIPYASIITNSTITLAGLASHSDYPANSNFAIVRYTYNSNLGINETKITDDFKIFPTVFSDNINITCKKETALDINIFDSTGKMIYKKTNFNCGQDPRLLLSASSLNEGIYWLKINSAGKTSAQKLIKK